MADLSRKRDRDRLSPRREPYWQRLAEGAYLGFRRGPDTWIARYRSRDRDGKGHRKQLYQTIGEALEFDDAKSKAEAWLAQLTGSAVRAIKRATVRSALETYIADLKRHGRADTAKRAEGHFRTAIYEDRIAKMPLEAATHDDFLEWRDRLLPGRQPRTVNRLIRAVTAGLNRAQRVGHLGNPSAWRLGALPDDTENETAVFLSPEQRKALIDAASPSAALFLRGLELSGARPIELAASIAGDFDDGRLRLSHRKGRPPKLRTRYVVLDAAGVAFFKAQAKGKLPAAPLFTENGEQTWRRHIWAQEVRAAIAAHNKDAKGSERIPPAASAYSFRHARISELLQVHGIDPLTTAQQTGTSLAMIERSYFRFIPSAMREKLSGEKAKDSKA